MRAIDADRLLEERRIHTYYHLPNGDIAIPLIDIKNAPTIEPRCETCEAFNKTRLLIPQPQRKKGKWIRDAVWFTRYHCSQCGEKTEDTIMGEPRYKWCPMCGADMRGEQDDS